MLVLIGNGVDVAKHYVPAIDSLFCLFDLGFFPSDSRAVTSLFCLKIYELDHLEN